MPKTFHTKKIYEFIVRSKPSSPATLAVLRNIFSQLGVKEENVTESIVDGKSALSVFFIKEQQAKHFQVKLRRFGLKNISARLRSLESRDWQEKWKEDFQPFRITREVDVAPVWHKKNYRSPRKIIYIDTVLAFGTGLHETTQFMAKFIEQRRGKFNSFLDVGTGTGILSILAFVYGAQQVEAVDIDKNCIPVAKTNLSANGFKFGTIKAVDIGCLKTKKQFDFVAANLISGDLIKLREKLYALVAPGKYLAVSGISHENFYALRKTMAKLPLRCLKVSKGRKWVAVLYQRKHK